ncbi:hypothetical protein BSLG_002138 [Batrachochytrium salamandrivorans]|nr:hypothetical protein BSLG_002138 [Batrachochytrium salamandrivorans]
MRGHQHSPPSPPPPSSHSRSASGTYRPPIYPTQQQSTQPSLPRDDYSRPSLWERESDSHGAFGNINSPTPAFHSIPPRYRHAQLSSQRNDDLPPSSFTDRSYLQTSSFSNKSGSGVDDHPPRSDRYVRGGGDSHDPLPRRLLSPAAVSNTATVSSASATASSTAVATPGVSGMRGGQPGSDSASASYYKIREGYVGGSQRNMEKEIRSREDRFGSVGSRGAYDRDSSYGSSPRFGDNSMQWKRPGTSQNSGRDHEDRWLLPYERDRSSRFDHDRDLERPPGSQHPRDYLRSREDNSRSYYGDREYYMSRGSRDYYSSRNRSPPRRSSNEYQNMRIGAGYLPSGSFDRRSSHSRPLALDMLSQDNRPPSPIGSLYRRSIKSPTTLMGSMHSHQDQHPNADLDDTFDYPDRLSRLCDASASPTLENRTPMLQHTMPHQDGLLLQHQQHARPVLIRQSVPTTQTQVSSDESDNEDEDEEDRYDHEYIEEQIEHVDNEIANHERLLATLRAKIATEAVDAAEAAAEAAAAAAVSEVEEQGHLHSDSGAAMETLSHRKTPSEAKHHLPDLILEDIRTRAVAHNSLEAHSHESVIDQVIRENQSLARELRNRMFTRNKIMVGSAKFATKIFPSPSDFDFYRENIKLNLKIRPHIVNRVRQQMQAQVEFEANLLDEHESLNHAWLERAHQMEEASLKKAHDMPGSVTKSTPSGFSLGHGSLLSNALPAVHIGRSTRRTGQNSDVVRTEADWQDVLVQLGITNETEQRQLERSVKEPDMIIDPAQRIALTFVNRNGLVHDPAENLAAYNNNMNLRWSDEERDTLRVKLMQNGKNFNKISASLPHKSTADCIQYYYREKVNLRFKQLLRQTSGMGRGRRRKEKINVLIAPSFFKTYLLMSDEEVVHVRPTPSRILAREREGDESAGEDDMPASKSNTGVAGKIKKRLAGGQPKETMGGMVVSPTMINDPGRETAVVDVAGAGSGDDHWTDAEKAKALHAFDFVGRNFDTMASMVKTKTSEQCKSFYNNHRRKVGEENALRDQTDVPLASNEPQGQNSSSKRKQKEATGASKKEKRKESFSNLGKRKRSSDVSIVDDLATLSFPTPLHNEADAIIPDPPLPNVDATEGEVGQVESTAMVTDGHSNGHPVDKASSDPLQIPQDTKDVVSTPGEEIGGFAFTQQLPVGVLTEEELEKPKKRSARKKAAHNATPTHPVKTTCPATSLLDPISVSHAVVDSTHTAETAELFSEGIPHFRDTLDNSNSQHILRKTISYWSVSERSEFIKGLSKNGRSWDAISKGIGSKSAIQVRNYYHNYRQKLEFDRILFENGHVVDDASFVSGRAAASNDNEGTSDDRKFERGRSDTELSYASRSDAFDSVSASPHIPTPTWPDSTHHTSVANPNATLAFVEAPSLNPDADGSSMSVVSPNRPHLLSSSADPPKEPPQPHHPVKEVDESDLKPACPYPAPSIVYADNDKESYTTPHIKMEQVVAPVADVDLSICPTSSRFTEQQDEVVTKAQSDPRSISPNPNLPNSNLPNPNLSNSTSLEVVLSLPTKVDQPCPVAFREDTGHESILTVDSAISDTHHAQKVQPDELNYHENTMPVVSPPSQDEHPQTQQQLLRSFGAILNPVYSVASLVSAVSVSELDSCLKVMSPLISPQTDQPDSTCTFFQPDPKVPLASQQGIELHPHTSTLTLPEPVLYPDPNSNSNSDPTPVPPLQMCEQLGSYSNPQSHLDVAVAEQPSVPGCTFLPTAEPAHSLLPLHATSTSSESVHMNSQAIVPLPLHLPPSRPVPSHSFTRDSSRQAITIPSLNNIVSGSFSKDDTDNLGFDFHSSAGHQSEPFDVHHDLGAAPIQPRVSNEYPPRSVVGPGSLSMILSDESPEIRGGISSSDLPVQPFTLAPSVFHVMNSSDVVSPLYSSNPNLYNGMVDGAHGSSQPQQPETHVFHHTHGQFQPSSQY